MHAIVVFLYPTATATSLPRTPEDERDRDHIRPPRYLSINSHTAVAMKLFAAAILAVASIAAAHSRHCPHYSGEIVHGTSHNAHGLKRFVTEFQHRLGGKNNGASIGPLKDGFRVINWDGGAPFDMPFDFFNTNAPLGALFFAKGNKFAISNPVDNNPVDDTFDSINRRAAKDFIAFSEKRLFTPVLDNVMATKFQVPGKTDPATVSGFGAVFVDVKKRHTSYLELKDAKGCRIAKVYVPPKSKGLSFVGVVVKRVRYSRHGKFYKVKAPVYVARMKLGNLPITKHLGHHSDIVVTDDFIYGEPQKLNKHH